MSNQVTSNYNKMKMKLQYKAVRCKEQVFHANLGNKLHLIQLLFLSWQWLSFEFINGDCIIHVLLLTDWFLALLAATCAARGGKKNKNQNHRDSQSSSAGKRQTVEPFAEFVAQFTEFTMVMVVMFLMVVFVIIIIIVVIITIILIFVAILAKFK